MTAPSIVVPGATAALCRRTNFRKGFLAPWHEDVMGIWLYSLALAQQKTNVAIHQTTLVVSHHHTEVTSTEANLPDFKRILHGESSKALNALMARERYDQPHQVWDDRGTHTMRLMDAEAQAAHMVYGHVNTVAAGLVRTPSEMPGWTFDFGLWKGGTILVRRPSPATAGRSRRHRRARERRPPPRDALRERFVDGFVDGVADGFDHGRTEYGEPGARVRGQREGEATPPRPSSAAPLHPWHHRDRAGR